MIINWEYYFQRSYSKDNLSHRCPSALPQSPFPQTYFIMHTNSCHLEQFLEQQRTWHLRGERHCSWLESIDGVPDSPGQLIAPALGTWLLGRGLSSLVPHGDWLQVRLESLTAHCFHPAVRWNRGHSLLRAESQLQGNPSIAWTASAGTLVLPV